MQARENEYAPYIINKRSSTEKDTNVRALIFDSQRPSYRPHYDTMEYALALAIFTLKESVQGP